MLGIRIGVSHSIKTGFWYRIGVPFQMFDYQPFNSVSLEVARLTRPDLGVMPFLMNVEDTDKFKGGDLTINFNKLNSL